MAEPALAAGIGEDSGSKKDLHALGAKKPEKNPLEHFPFLHGFLLNRAPKSTGMGRNESV